MPNIKNVELSKIRIDGGTQARARIDTDVVADYAERLIELPDADVFFDGAEFWLAEGFHRYHAHAKAGRKTMRVRVRKGTVRDAILYAAGANATHGLRRTNEDKRKAVEMLLADAEWRKWSDRNIAKQCGVSHNFVGETRRSLSSDDSENPADAPAARTYNTRHGTPATMRIANIGQGDQPAATPEPAAEEQSAPEPEQHPDRKPAPEVEPPTPPAASKPPRAENKPAAPKGEEPPTDAVGGVLPKNLRADFETAPAFRSLMKRLSDLKSEFKQLCGERGGQWANRRRQTTLAHFDNVHAELRFAVPHGVCPSCGGRGCDDCKQFGFLPEEMYKAVPDALKPQPRGKGKAA
jgi:hypothetical protein